MSKQTKSDAADAADQELVQVDAAMNRYAHLPQGASADYCAYAGDNGFRPVNIQYEQKCVVQKNSDDSELASFDNFADAWRYANTSTHKCTVCEEGYFACTEADIKQLYKNKEIEESYKENFIKRFLGEYEPLIRQVLLNVGRGDIRYTDADVYSQALDLLTIFKQHKVKYEQPKRSNE